MSLRRNRVLDRLWLSLSGAAALSVALHAGTQLGLRSWFPRAGTAAPAAQAAVAEESGPAAGCRDAGSAAVRGPGPP
ncbi:hypothetical protein [Methylobacterium sp. J-070]|uniref:hypothetical protein n=1 Tax=Methylobacterium sp. J-070 TaxID=2836650 RepID=UPI001FB990CE|nr:hypothetical protein [Methylobacterium sp. J-070]MCJ2049704.1 hypothetical protein [Methylobacterium sp. J-070]